MTETFLTDVDGTWKEEGYNSRSEFIRDVLRDAIKSRFQPSGPEGDARERSRHSGGEHASERRREGGSRPGREQRR